MYIHMISVLSFPSTTAQISIKTNITVTTSILQYTHFIRLYTNSSAMSRPSLEYVVSTNTNTFGSIRNLASERWSCVWCPSGDLLLLNVPHRINGDGFVSRWINLFHKNIFKLLLKTIFSFYLMSNASNANQFINLALVFEHKTINIQTYKLTTKYNMRRSENHSNQCTDSELIDLFFYKF